MEAGLTRGEFLGAAAGAAAGLLLAPATSAAAGQASSYQSFYSRPDLRPPLVSVSVPGSPTASSGEGFLFLGPTGQSGAQAGPMIVDPTGQLVWFEPVSGGRWVSNFRTQEYRGGPVLTYWEGAVDRAAGYGRGTGRILDASYGQVALIRAGNGRHADLHEFTVTPEGTVLLTCYPETVRADLQAAGGPANGQVLESVIQEVEIATGRVLFEWRSLEHIPVSESYYPAGHPYDYFHANSVDLTPDGHLLVSARHTCAVYKLHRRSGRVLWRLGGKRSDFRMGPGTRFAWQHDARSLVGGRISLFDDGAGARATESQSRGLVLAIDHGRRTASLAAEFRHPRPLLAYAMGNLQVLGDGDAIVGWGNIPGLSEFAADGTLLMDLRLPWGHTSYRAFRLPWSANPSSAPAVSAAVGTSGSATLYVSWNGATEVASWQVSEGPSASELRPLTTVPRTGFETAIPLSASAGYAAVTALGAAGQPLATSPAVAL